MIPLSVVTAWRGNADWPRDEQVEQDLIISRALIEIFNNEYIKDKVAFRGGTALHKLFFPSPLRYSEDIDLNRLETGDIKPLLFEIRNALKGFLGTKRSIDQTKSSVKISYKYKDVSKGTRKLKIEINTHETLPQRPLEKIPFNVHSNFFKGDSILSVFNREEMVGTKIRALYQRKKGRDLFDLYMARELGLNWDRVVDSFKLLNIGVSSKEYMQNLDER